MHHTVTSLALPTGERFAVVVHGSGHIAHRLHNRNGGRGEPVHCLRAHVHVCLFCGVRVCAGWQP